MKKEAGIPCLVPWSLCDQQRYLLPKQIEPAYTSNSPVD
ncbi:MAG: hypothetical protein ACI87O_001899 [Planctomycetota bacterium]|jgi:hypothetical protein